jgi:hypothetical protein
LGVFQRARSKQPQRRIILPKVPKAATEFITAAKREWRDVSLDVSFVHDEQNPDHDVLPSDEYKCYNLPNGRHLFYLPSGSLLGSLPRWKVDDLWRRFNASMLDVKIWNDFDPGSFVEEVCLLLKRYINGERTDKTGQSINLKNHWAVPSDVFAPLSAAFKIPTERFASPLNVSQHTTSYYSVYARDALFGVSRDAYSCHWRGSSEANPEYNTAEMDKALSWSIASAASTSEPVLTVLVLPVWRDRAVHLRRLQHPMVQQVAFIPRGRFNFTPASYTNLGERPSHHAHFDVQILVVSNRNGHHEFFDAAKFQAFEAALQAHGRHQSDQVSWPLNARHPKPIHHTGKISLSKLFSAKQPEAPAAPPAPLLRLPAFDAPSSISRELKWDNNHILYTGWL